MNAAMDTPAATKITGKVATMTPASFGEAMNEITQPAIRVVEASTTTLGRVVTRDAALAVDWDSATPRSDGELVGVSKNGIGTFSIRVE